MSSAPPPNDNPTNNEKKPEQSAPSSSSNSQDSSAMDTTPDLQPPEETWDDIPEDILSLSTEDIVTRTRLIDNDLKVRCLPQTSLRD
jgi:26S proteasome regulatory subunit T5